MKPRFTVTDQADQKVPVNARCICSGDRQIDDDVVDGKKGDWEEKRSGVREGHRVRNLDKSPS